MRWFAKRKDSNHGYLVENVGMDGAGRRASHNEAVRACALDQGAGHDGIRDPRGRTRGHRHHSHHGISTQAAGALERHRRGNQRAIDRLLERTGQSTVEFAVVTAGFLAATVALGTMWHAFSDGLIVEHALAVASHHIQGAAPATIADIFLY